MIMARVRSLAKEGQKRANALAKMETGVMRAAVWRMKLSRSPATHNNVLVSIFDFLIQCLKI